MNSKSTRNKPTSTKSIRSQTRATATVNRLIKCLQESADVDRRPISITIDMRKTIIHDSFNKRVKVDGDENTVTLGYKEKPYTTTIAREDLIREIMRLQGENNSLRQENHQLSQERSSLQNKLIAMYEHGVIHLTAYPAKIATESAPGLQQ